MAEEASGGSSGGAAPAPEPAPAEQSAPAEESAPAEQAPAEQEAPTESAPAEQEAPTESAPPPDDAAQGEKQPEGDATPPPTEAGQPGEETTEGGSAEQNASPEAEGEAHSEFREAVYAQEPPTSSGEAMRAVGDEVEKAGERITTATDDGTRAWAATEQDWRGAPAEEAGRRATELAENGRATGELAKSVANAARASADQADQARATDEELLTGGEGDWQLARALLPEGEKQVAETQVAASTAEATRQNHAAAQAGIRQSWEGITDEGAAPAPPEPAPPAPDPAAPVPDGAAVANPAEPGKPNPNAPAPAPVAGPEGTPAAGTVPEAAQNLDAAQNALAQAGQNDPVADLPAPPSDEDLLRDYQVEDDWLPPIQAGGRTFTWSEALASLEGDNPAEHILIEDTASSAPMQVFPDPDGKDGPLGGRSGTGNNHRDAFRHAYWNALMSRTFGESSAERVATGHERRPDDPNEDPMFEARAEAMDMYNNQIGRQIAESLGPESSDEAVRGAIEQAVREGKLVVFNEDYTGLVPSGDVYDFPPPQ